MGSWLLVGGCWMLVVGCWLLVVGCWFVDSLVRCVVALLCCGVVVVWRCGV